MNTKKIREAKRKREEKITWMKVIFVPFVVGFSLVASSITMPLFRLIGWVLLLFGIASGGLYLFIWYKKHEENIKKGKDKILGMVKKK